MINCIAGKPGGGKSYEAVKNHIIPAIEDGRRVVTNLPIVLEHFIAVYGKEITQLLVVVEYDFHKYGTTRPFSIIEDWTEHQDWKNDKGQGVLFVVDEAHLSLPVPRNSKVDLSLVLEFLSMHRHYGFDILLLTQNTKKLHIDIRDMIQLVYRCIKLSAFGKDDSYVLKIHEGCSSVVVNTKQRDYEPYVFPFYKSHTKSETSIQEANSQDVTPWYKHKAMIYGLAMITISAFLFSSIFINKEKKHEEKQTNELKKEPGTQQVNELKKEPIQPQPTKPKNKTNRQSQDDENLTEYKTMVAKSDKYHPFYKVQLAVTGYAEDIGFKVVYFAAHQNGQEIFSITSNDLMLAGYELRVLTPCSVRIKYHNFEDFIVCSKPQQHLSVGSNDQIASNN